MSGFLSKIPSTMTTGLDLAHYRLIDGFLDSSFIAQECGIMLDMRVTCVSASARNSLRPKLANLANKVAHPSSGANPKDQGILTFMTFESHDDDVSARIYARFTTRAAMEQFLRRSDVEGFWIGSKEEVAKMESRAYLHNGKGWLHRGMEKSRL